MASSSAYTSSVGPLQVSLSPAAYHSRPQHQRGAKFNTWKMMTTQRFQLHGCQDVTGRLVMPAHDKAKLGPHFVKRKLPLLFFANLDNQAPLTETDIDDLDEENEDLVQEDFTNGIPYTPMGMAEGKPGFVSFCGPSYPIKEEGTETYLAKEPSKFLWFIAPTILVASFVFPSLYMRKLVLVVFEDSLLTDFLILFFTEALFYSGVAIFVLLLDHVWRPLFPMVPRSIEVPKYQYGLRISSVAILVLSLTIPLVTMGMVWPWTGPAASATLAPYLVGLVVQFAFEQYARHIKSTAWLVIPVIFQVYRLHQLNRAAQLVTALAYSVRGAETSSQTLAISNSLGTLLNVLQLLGIICVWSLASFLMRFLPSPVWPDS